MSAPLPDARPANWVDRRAPPSFRPWLRLGRFDRPTGVWLLMLPGWQGAALFSASRGELPDPILLLKIAVGAALMRAAGCAYNDLADRDLDAKVARTAGRPLASGQISARGAWVFILACAAPSLLILLSLNILGLFLGVASLALVAAYPFMKRITWWPQAWLGLTFNWGALLGYAAAAAGPSAANVLHLLSGAWARGYQLSVVVKPLPASAWLLYAGGVFWTLGYDTIYAVQDLEDDALAGVKSSARRLGQATATAVVAFYLAALVLAAGAGLAAGLGIWFVLLLAVYAHRLLRQPGRLDRRDPSGALALFKSNAVAGLVLFLAIAAGALPV
ncbi:MAG: UbiA family prenyltransferase [Caulobacteraceae bacterium]